MKRLIVKKKKIKTGVKYNVTKRSFWKEHILDFVDFQPPLNKNQIMSKFDTEPVTPAFNSVGSYSSYFTV